MFEETNRLSVRYHVPPVFTIIVDTECKLVARVPSIDGWFRIYRLAFYNQIFREITIYTRDVDSKTWPTWKLHNLFHHEWLHYYDHCCGVDCPDNHNDLFDQRIKDMGLWEGAEDHLTGL